MAVTFTRRGMPRGGRRAGEVAPARLAAVALQALHEAALDVLLAPAPLAAQPHRSAPSANPTPTDMGDLRCLKTLGASRASLPLKSCPKYANKLLLFFAIALVSRSLSIRSNFSWLPASSNEYNFSLS